MRKEKQPATLSRAMLACLLKMHQLFLEQFRDPNPNRRYANASDLAKVVNKSVRTVYRMVEIMQDDFCLPVDIVEGRGGYGYLEEVTNFPAIQFTQGELIALFAALNVLKSVRGNPFNDSARSAFEKLALALEGQLTVDLDELESVVCFRSGGFPAPVDPAYIDAATRAALAREEMVIHYRKLPQPGEKPKTKVHRIQPYFLLCASEVWYLYSFDLDAKAIRRFALTRLRRMESTGKAFKRPPDYDREKIIGAGFGPGIFGDDNPVEVRIRFTGREVHLIRERIWHPTQAIKSLARKGEDPDTADIELTMEVSLNLDLENWILGWGNSAEVLTPDSLKVTLDQRVERTPTK